MMRRALFAAHVTGTAGTNLVLLYIGDGRIGGIDGGRGKYEGTAEALPNGALRASLTLTVAPGTPLITGGAPSPTASTIPVEFELPPGFEQAATTIAISTPIGQVKAQFEKVMDLH